MSLRSRLQMLLARRPHCAIPQEAQKARARTGSRAPSRSGAARPPPRYRDLKVEARLELVRLPHALEALRFLSVVCLLDLGRPGKPGQCKRERKGQWRMESGLVGARNIGYAPRPASARRKGRDVEGASR